MERIDDSPLLTKINTKLNELGDACCEIRVSITPQAEYFERERGETSYVKWLNWQIYDNNNILLFQSDLTVVHGMLTENVLEADLFKFFPEKRISIDNEIYFEE